MQSPNEREELPNWGAEPVGEYRHGFAFWVTVFSGLALMFAVGYGAFHFPFVAK